MKLKKAVTMLSLALLLSIYLAAGSQDEAYGRVVKVVDGDTIDVQLQDSLISEDLIRRHGALGLAQARVHDEIDLDGE